jgi:hypothetical protein
VATTAPPSTTNCVSCASPSTTRGPSGTARSLALETGAPGDRTTSATSSTVQWLIDSAEQDAQRIRAEAEEETRAVAMRAEELLRHRVDLVDEAQHEADTCRAQAAEEARLIVHDALEKASTLLRGLQESEVSLQEMFASGSLSHRMPPPRRSVEQSRGQHAAEQDTVQYQTNEIAAGPQFIPPGVPPQQTVDERQLQNGLPQG